MRIGKFYIASRLVYDEPHQVRLVLDGMIVVRCEHLWHRGVLEYVAIGDVFDENPEGAEPPLYDCIIDAGEVNRRPPFVTWQRS